MKILFLYRYIPGYDYDNHLHMMFADAINRTEGVDLLAYGPNLHFGYPSLTPIAFNKDINIRNLHARFPFDIMVICTKSRAFEYYDPHNDKAEGMWLPSGWDTFPCPKIVLEEDYHYEKSDDWYQRHNISLILQRHYSQSLRQDKVPMMWFPFSVDIDMFKPKHSMICRYCQRDNKEPRHNKICFAGSTNAGAYLYRNRAIEILKQEKLIDSFQRREKVGYNYVECLQQYVAHLCCSSIYNLTSAKMFEIMASGSVLLTNENADLPLLFEADSYVTYKNDHTDLLEKTRFILNNPEAVERIIDKALLNIKNRHSHTVRINQLIKIINSLTSGNIEKIVY